MRVLEASEQKEMQITRKMLTNLRTLLTSVN